jgi:RNA polymerase sigma factor (TIGR02999 family)
VKSGVSYGPELTRSLKEWSNGDASALERLTPLVYDELHRLAHQKLSRLTNRDVMQPSALVNEAFVRLLAGAPVDWSSRTHFFAHTAVLMRRILIDFARERHAAKRGHRVRTYVSGLWDTPGVDSPRLDFLDLDRALNDLGEVGGRLARVVELRYFGGLSVEETAEVLRVSDATVIREWRAARAWLYSRLQSK